MIWMRSVDVDSVDSEGNEDDGHVAVKQKINAGVAAAVVANPEEKVQSWFITVSLGVIFPGEEAGRREQHRDVEVVLGDVGDAAI